MVWFCDLVILFEGWQKIARILGDHAYKPPSVPLLFVPQISDFRFLHMTDVEKSEILPNLKKQIKFLHI